MFSYTDVKMLGTNPSQNKFFEKYDYLFLIFGKVIRLLSFILCLALTTSHVLLYAKV